MGNDEAVTPSKLDKASSPAQEQVAVHPYPDWAAMQAYYGPGVPYPPPYFSPAVASGHPPHPYMWGAKPLVPPFGAPYPTIYPHGVYAHPSMNLVASPSSTDLPVKSSGNKDRGLVKKLKGFDGLAVSIGNVNAETRVAISHSGDDGARGSSDGSDDSNESEGKVIQRKRSSEDALISGNKKAGTPANGDQSGEVKAVPNLSSGFTIPPSAIMDKPINTVPASSSTPPAEFRVSTANQVKTVLHHAESWGQGEKESKRERRKQSNRESARRSRLRKQAETEELAVQVESLNAEIMTLRSEIGRLKENSDKLKVENSSLMEKLRIVNNQEAPSVVVENFLSRIDKLREEETLENSSGGKLHQLLDANPRTDAVAAG